MELKLHALMASIPHAVFTHSSFSILFCTYAVLDASRRPNGNTSSRSTHKIPPLCKEKHLNEQKLKLDHQNQNNLNVGLVALCGEGNHDQNAQRVFDQMSDKNITSWHLMIGGYISNGLGCDGLLVFQQMKQAGVPSDGETFELFFTACAQAGGGGLVSVRGGVVVGGTVVTKEVGEVIDEVAVPRVISFKQ
ncbi:hypothetical protein JHK84_047955 [Glycine max]|nr:hypothetical protein JHK86_047928 [Glycine max]KAG4943892.1 hypothetical protein JHK85_048538 [Glycine max]KAG5102986.1 hypothetical protein JHK84_047955 [Glycine max]